MTTSALTEDERNKLVDLVHRRGGDELLATEVVHMPLEVPCAP